MTTSQKASNVQQEVQQQAGKLIAHYAGFVGYKTIEIGQKSGLLKTLAQSANGLSVKDLAAQAGTDEFYTGVWARAAYAAELVEVDDHGRYALAPHIADLLVNEDFPGYVGGIPGLFSQPEFIDNFAGALNTGEHIWWEDTSPEFITAVSKTGWPFYNRLIPKGLDNVPGLPETLSGEARVLELGSGVGRGLVKFASTFPGSAITGVDGDRHSVDRAAELVEHEGMSDRIALVQSTLEDFVEDDAFDLAFINISMHECRDMDRVTDNVKRSLKPGGWFVISDLPFPDSKEGLRTPAARVLTGIQYYEAQIEDQLLPTAAFVKLLEQHGFRDVGSVDISPLHNLIFGRK